MSEREGAAPAASAPSQVLAVGSAPTPSPGWNHKIVASTARMIMAAAARKAGAANRRVDIGAPPGAREPRVAGEAVG